MCYRLPRAVGRGEVILRLVVRQTAVLTRLDEGPATVREVRCVMGLRRTIIIILLGRRPRYICFLGRLMILMCIREILIILLFTYFFLNTIILFYFAVF